jgi:hypothetical protein
MTQRTLTTGFRREVEREATAEIALIFLEITHPALAETLRVVNDSKDFVFRGFTYSKASFELQLLTDNERPPEGRLSVQNVDQRIGNSLRLMREPARIRLDVVAGSQFNLAVDPRTEITPVYTEYTADYLYLIDVEVDAMMAQGRIVSWDYTQELWPGVRATQDRLPGLFR